MKKLAIIGASYLQKPLVIKAKEMGIETHVFAWEEGNVVGDITDFYYPILITKKQKILEKCKEVKIDGITSIASDVAMPTVNYIAEKLNLVGNGIEATKNSTDKIEMRKTLSKAGVPCPTFNFFKEPVFENDHEFNFPVIVKPTDRSGARGVTKVETPDKVNNAIEKALDISFSKKVRGNIVLLGKL
jgi:biotin carboxylase